MNPFTILFGILGFALVGYGAGWATAIGVFIMMWADNYAKGRM